MNGVFDAMLDFLGEAWTVLTSTLVILASIGFLIQALRASGSAVAGSRYGLSGAVAAFCGLLLLVLYALLAVPALAQAAEVTGSECGPLVSLGAGISRLIAALASLRLLIGAFRASVFSVLGSGSAISEMLAESGEAIAGMLLATAAAPVAAHFLGVC